MFLEGFRPDLDYIFLHENVISAHSGDNAGLGWLSGLGQILLYSASLFSMVV